MDGDQLKGLEAHAHPGVSPIKVKKIGHFVYEVADVARSVKFWTEVMGLAVTEANEMGITFLRYGPDHHTIGVIATDAKRNASAPPAKVQHLAFEVENVDALFAARDHLRRNNVPIVAEGRKGAGSNIGINFLDPDGIQFELYCEMDQIDATGRVRPRAQWSRAKTLEEAVAKPPPKTW